MKIQHGYCTGLCLLLVLFCMRVMGQALVAFWHVEFLPPMEEWYSGLVPYPVLLPCQFLIIALYGKVCWDFFNGRGFFVTPQKTLGVLLTRIGTLYMGAMIVRYAIRMALFPEARWLGGCLPIIFHWVLALFLLLLGRYHRHPVKVSSSSR